MSEIVNVILRGFLGYISLLIFTRILGKQQIAQLTFFDYIQGITIGSIAASLTVDLTSSALLHWVGLATWAIAGLITQLVTSRYRWIANYINGEPTVLIMNGKIMEQAMKRIRYTMAELTEQLRDKGVFDISQVEFAILEVNGQLSVQKKAAYQPVTPKDLNISVQDYGLTSDIIYQGVFIEKNIKHFNLDKNWLISELNKQGINDVAEVAFATIDRNGNLFIDKYNDQIDIDAEDYPGIH